MKQSVTFAAVLTSMALTACGGASGGDTVATSTQVTSGSASEETQTAAAAGSKAAAENAPAACSLLARRDVSRAFGVRAPAGQEVGAPTQCAYRKGSHSLSITITPAPAEVQRTFGHPPFAQHQGLVSVPGAVALERTFIKAGPIGAQTQVVLLKSATTVQLLLTDTTKKHGSLRPAVLRVARAAARRL